MKAPLSRPAEAIRRALLHCRPDLWAALAVLLAFLAPATRVRADQLTYSTTKSITATDWTNTVSLNRFDPANGTLQGVTWILAYSFNSNARLENLDAVARAGVVHGANVTLTVWNSSSAVLVSAANAVKFTNSLAKYDGVSDFAGTSGVSLAARTVNGTVNTPVAGSLASYVGNGQMSLPVNAHAAGFATGLSTFLQQVSPKAGFTLTVVYDYLPKPLGASIGDTVWNDLNGNGSLDPGEPGIPGVTVTLLDHTLAAVPGYLPTTTDASGYYTFTDVPAGDYVVVVDPPVGFVATYDADGVGDASYSVSLSVGAGDNRDDIDFGLAQLSSTLGDRVWRDDNGNGVQDLDEVGIEGVTVSLLDGSGSTVLATTVTDSGGGYGFTGLTAGSYRLSLSGIPSGYVATSDPDGVATPNVALIELPAGAAIDTADFGYQPQTSSVAGVIWKDSDRDGVVDTAETGLSGVVVSLYDTTGTIVQATVNTDTQGHYNFGGLAAGHHVIVVTAPSGYWTTYDTDGVGTPNQSEVTLAPASAQTGINFGYSGGTLGDRVWNDLDGNGVQDAGEPGLPGATVTLNTGATTTTDANGYYSFPGLPVGTYTVTVSAPAGWVATGDPDGVNTPGVAVATLVAGVDRADVDFGYQEQDAHVGDRVWRDDNSNGIQDGGEPGLAGVVVQLRNAAGTTVLATTTSDSNGFYGFGSLAAGTYTLVATQPAHSLPTFDLDGPSVPNVAVVVLTAGQSRNDADFGYLPLGMIGSLVWLDLDGNGAADPGGSEPGLSGIPVTASGTGGTFTTLTDDYGFYAFTDLPPGTYTVGVTVPPGLTPTFDADGVGTPNVAVLALPAGSDRLDVDFGYGIASNLSDGQIGDLVWLDANGNGYVDGTEAGLANVSLSLLDSNNVTVATTVTDAGGNYLFSGLVADTYTVVVNPPGGLTATYDLDGIASLSRSTVTIENGEQRFDLDFGYRVTPPLLAQIAGVVWNDSDGNGSANNGEAGLAGLGVLLANAGGTVATAVTDVSGAYLFPNIPAGSYTVSVAPPTYWGATYDLDGIGTPNAASLSVVAGQHRAGVDFGYQYAPPPGAIGDRVWNDANGDGVQDAGEAGVAGVPVALYAADGSLLANVTTDAGGYYGFQSVPSGTYTVLIVAPQYWDATHDLDGGVTPNESIVAVSIGQERSDVDFGLHYNPPPALIGDRVWNDANSNGIQDAGETGLANVAVTLLDGASNVVATAITDPQGRYEFPGLSTGGYSVSIVAPQYYIPSYDLDGISTTNTASLSVAIGETNRLVDFGLVYAPPLGSIGDRVWIDVNSNGILDAGELGMTNVLVTLADGANGVLATATTDANGRYRFTGLSAKTYQVTVSAPTNAKPTFDLDGTTTPNTATVALAIGEDRTDVDFGYVLPVAPLLGSIGDQLWSDLNNNGVKDGTEPGLTNVVVTLHDGANQVVATATTDAAGKYLFTGLPADTYTVTVVPPANYFASYDLDGVVTPNSATLLLVAGDNRTDVDFGYIFIAPDPMTGAIGDLVWSDTNGNGIREGSEPGLAGVGVELRNSANAVIATLTTSPTGGYQFTGLGAGSYTVVVVPPANYTPTSDRDGIATANRAVVALGAGQVVHDANFGYMPPQLATIGDRVWIDANGNGVQDAAEVGMTNLPVVLFNSGGTAVLTNYTGANGGYAFSNLTVGTYKVVVTPPANFGPTYDADGIGTPNNTTVTVTWGEARLDIDFGYAVIPGTGKIGDLVWVDANSNGVRDSGESGLPNSTVRLYDNQSGVLLGTKVTDSNGAYLFTGLGSGTYLVTVSPPTGYTPTYDLDGLATPNRVVVTLGSGQGRTDLDFGYMITPLGNATGSSPGYWSKKGLPLVTPGDLVVLSALRLVDDNGAEADFVNPTTGAFGGAYSANVATARAAFGVYEAKGTAINMASQLSRQLAAFVLDMRFGEFPSTTLMDCSAVAGGKITAADLVALADSALRANAYTPTGNANRAYQEILKNALQTGYTTYGMN